MPWEGLDWNVVHGLITALTTLCWALTMLVLRRVRRRNQWLESERPPAKDDPPSEET